MRPIRITRHARNRMRWHDISEELIREALLSPDRQESSIAGRVNRWKRIGDRFLRGHLP